MSAPSRRRARLEIVEVDAWRRAIAWIYAHRDGQWVDWQRETGLRQSTLFKLKGEHVRQVAEPVYDQIRGHVSKLVEQDTNPPKRALDAAVTGDVDRYVQEARPAHVLRDLTNSVVERATGAILSGYDGWLRERRQRFFTRRGPTFLNPGQAIQAATRDASIQIARQLLGPGARIVKQPIPDLSIDDASPVELERWHNYLTFRKVLDRNETVARSLTKFEVDARKAGHSDDRIQLAVLRILEPLLEAPESSFVERRLAELIESGDLAKFIAAGITRERILLARPIGRARAQEVRDFWAAKDV